MPPQIAATACGHEPISWSKYGSGKLTLPLDNVEANELPKAIDDFLHRGRTRAQNEALQYLENLLKEDTIKSQGPDRNRSIIDWDYRPDGKDTELLIACSALDEFFFGGNLAGKVAYEFDRAETEEMRVNGTTLGTTLSKVYLPSGVPSIAIKLNPRTTGWDRNLQRPLRRLKILTCILHEMTHAMLSLFSCECTSERSPSRARTVGISGHGPSWSELLDVVGRSFKLMFTMLLLDVSPSATDSLDPVKSALVSEEPQLKGTIDRLDKFISYMKDLGFFAKAQAESGRTFDWEPLEEPDDAQGQFGTTLGDPVSYLNTEELIERMVLDESILEMFKDMDVFIRLNGFLRGHFDEPPPSRGYKYGSEVLRFGYWRSINLAS
ncbi:MAG: hypothetical protein MMC23_009694 [Stictis urceolatum]|nr:hypothetical protein [Stictis urceolata]